MNFYEHTLIARQDTSPSQIKQIRDKYTKIIEDNDGNIIKFESWGLMHLSYLIKKNKKGNYLHFKIKGKGNKIKEYTLDANDGFNSLVRFENGAIGTITNTRYATGHANSLILEVFCTKGALKVELDEERTKWSTLHICIDENINKMAWDTIECPKTPSNYQNFIESIKTNLNMQPDFYQGAKIQNIIDKCIESNEIGRWVDV